jgi:anti-anti-sigma factor
MEIVRKKETATLVLEIDGRLDAAWCENLRSELAAAIRAGEHVIDLDLSRLDYISSAGLRVLFSTMKELKAIKGRLGLRNPSPAARKILDLSGLAGLFCIGEPGGSGTHQGQKIALPTGSLEVLANIPGGGLSVHPAGQPGNFDTRKGEACVLPVGTVAIGIGAFAEGAEQAAPHLGEVFAVAGCAAIQSVTGGGRPDYVIAEQGLVPSAWFAGGLVATGNFSVCGRFDVREDARSVGFTALCEGISEAVEAPQMAFVIAAETSGLVGASLRAVPDAIDPFALPGLRDWLGFTSERAFRDTTCLVVGFYSKGSSPLDAWLRQVNDETSAPLCHAHAAVFPYRPIQKGLLDLQETVGLFFESQALQAVLHLVNDTRQPGGSGDSEFLRGAFWAAPCQWEGGAA